METLKCIVSNNPFIALAKPRPVKRQKPIKVHITNQYFELSRHEGNQASDRSRFIATQFDYEGIC